MPESMRVSKDGTHELFRLVDVRVTKLSPYYDR
jgi:hypothetical protein